jgi:hypothetical protein
VQVDELEASAKRLRDRCSNLLNSAKKYRDALGTMLEAQQSFGVALQEFGGGTDDESLQIGKQWIAARYCTILASFNATWQLADQSRTSGLHGNSADVAWKHTSKRCRLMVPRFFAVSVLGHFHLISCYFESSCMG